MTALVTGATGFVGAAVARRVLAAGEAVRVLVRETSDRGNLAGLDVEIAIGDLAAPETLRAALGGCAALFHVAADYRIWCPDPAPMMAANVEGTRAIMRAAAEAGVARIVYTSSVAVLGLHADRSAADEDTASSLGDMIGPYKRSKFLAEQVVDDMVRDDGLPAVIVNPSMPVGPRDIKPTPTGRMIVEAAAGRMPAYVETGLNVVHVDDVAKGHWLAYERGEVGRRYILGGDNMSLQAILGEVAALVGRRPMTRVGRAVERSETQGFMKVLVDVETQQILGASLLGIGCDEIVHSLLDMMYAKAPYTVIQRAMHIHPTVTELIPTMLGELEPLDAA